MQIDATVVATALIAAIPAVIAAVVPLILALKGLKTEIKEIKVATDGMKTELVKVTQEKFALTGHAAGLVEGAQAEKERRQEANGSRPQPAAPAPIIVVVPAAVVAAPAGPTEVGTVSASTEKPDMSIKAKETKVDAAGATIIIEGAKPKP